MERQNTKNFITSGNINRVILTIATPLMINNLIRTLYNLTDGLYVAQLSAEDFAATAFIWPLNFLFISIGLGISVGATALIAQYFGANDLKLAKKYTWNTMALTFTFGFLLSTIGYIFAGQFVEWMGASGVFYEKSTAYLKINFIGLFFDFAYFGYQALLNAQGRTRVITVVSTISSITNVLLDPIFIFATIPFTQIPGLNAGIEGAAWATVISQMVSALLLFAYIPKFRSVKFQWEDFIPHMKQVEAIAALGLTSFIFQISALIVQIVSNNLLKTYGAMSIYGSEIPIAVGGIVSKVFVIFIALIIGMTQGVQPIVGYNYGAKHYLRVRQTIFLALKIGFVLSFVTWAVFEIFPLQIIELFGNGNDLYFEFGIRYMRYFMLFTLINGITILITTFFPAIGKAKTGAFLSLARQLLILLPVMLLMTYIFGVEGMMFATPVSDVISLVLCLFFFKRELHDIHMKEELILSK